ncbi:zona pellucida sperm-binding protein 3-like [Dendropsophus ebraccatus]|uniref:zona pellucida sperm-binding protein 3-like n=1 Tax=Dendropsophus ebraccatus TaxID=150705 RepID=UPI003831A63E
MTPDWLIYSNNLTVSLTPRTQTTSITLTNPAVVPIRCYYPRYGNVSSNAIKPTWIPFGSTVSSEERLVFSLRLMTEDWSAPRSSPVFSLGDVFYIEASLETQHHAPMTLFIERCVATISPDPSSSPSYEIIASYGCLMDGTQQDSSSAFRSPRPRPDKLQFTVDAFHFSDSQASTMYITCYLRAAADTQAPDPTNKACSYNKTSNSWSAVEGPSEICQCCNTQSCGAPDGQSRSWGPSYRRPRGLDGEVLQEPRLEDRRASAMVGPLLVLGEDQRRSLGMEGSSGVEMWLLVGVGGLSLVVVLVCVVFVVIGRLRRKNLSPRCVQE